MKYPLAQLRTANTKMMRGFMFYSRIERVLLLDGTTVASSMPQKCCDGEKSERMRDGCRQKARSAGKKGVRECDVSEGMGKIHVMISLSKNGIRLRVFSFSRSLGHNFIGAPVFIRCLVLP